MDVAAASAHGAVGALGALLVAGTVVAGLRSARDRGIWLVLAAAMALLWVSDLGATTPSGSPVGPWWALSLDLLAYALLYLAQMQLLARRLDVDVPMALLDILGGLTVAFALTSVVLLPVLGAAPGLDGAQAPLLLARPSAGLLLLLFSVVAVVLGRRTREVRSWLVVAAVALVAASDATAVWGLLNGGSGPGPGAAAVVVQLVPPLLVLLAAVCRTPAPQERTDQDAHVVLLEPAVSLVVCSGVLGWAHFAALPTAAVVSSLAGLALVATKVVLVFRRVTALNASRRQAMTDDLTGLGNRRALGAALATVDTGAAAALVLVDLDGFKEVNDELGHAAGDELLRLVAQRLRVHAHHGEPVVRQGGDEFALVLPGVGADAAAQRARLLTDRLAEPYDLGGREVVVAASAGVSAVPEHGRTAEELQRQADAAMYLAKSTGGGVVVHDRAVEGLRRERLQLAHELRDAAAAGDLVAHYQPQLAADGRLVGVEALVRWPHPERGVLAPGAFLELAEELGLMGALTEQVLGLALAEAAAWRRSGVARDAAGPGAAGPGVRVAVNVSATCLLDPSLIDAVAAALMTHGVPAQDLVLEITETELMREPATSHRVVSALVDLGVGVSIDDYGTGYSSLAYLRDLPASELKLDRSFVAATTADPRATAIVRTTVDLAHSLGLRLVAEGVEDAETLALLRALGADVTQGYHHSRPLPPEALRAWLSEHGAVVAAEV